MNGTMAEIRGFAGNFAPRAWAFCQGQLLSIAANQALFSLLGTTYGGDGRTSFGLPDLRGRTMVGPGTGPGLTPRNLGQRSGTQYNILTLNNLPSHTHTASGTFSAIAALPAYNDEGTTPDPENNYMAAATNPSDLNIYHTSSDGAVLGAGSVSGTATITIFNQGNNQQVNNMQPWLAIYYVICMFGVFPSRN